MRNGKREWIAKMIDNFKLNVNKLNKQMKTIFSVTSIVSISTPDCNRKGGTKKNAKEKSDAEAMVYTYTKRAIKAPSKAEKNY